MAEPAKSAPAPKPAPNATKPGAPIAGKPPVAKPGATLPPKQSARLQEAQAWAKQHGREFRGILRLVGKEMPGELSVERALPRIKGIGHNLSASLVQVLVKEGIASDAPMGALNDQEISRLEDVVKNPGKHGLPSFLLNRPKDPDTGTDRHLLAVDLTFATRQQIEREKEQLSYRGWRHSIGQKVRGQHTRSTGRTGMTVGVLKKAVKAQKAAAATGAQEKAAAPKAEAKK